MAQDPQREDKGRDREELLTTHALDMVTLWESSAIGAEEEAGMIRGLLDSNGIPTQLIGAPQFPNLGFQVQVPRGKLKEAQQLIEEAQASGPQAAEEAEAASEEAE